MQLERRIAIVNRGESAMRLIRAVRELNAEGGLQRHLIILHTSSERHATFVEHADTAVDIGPASERPYLDLEVLEAALRSCRADEAWVGWGFVAEDPAFVEMCERIGVTFVGPSPDAMRRLGDKVGSKQLAQECGVPLAPWSGGVLEDLEAALEKAEEIGYPMMLKASAGGGGRGIRLVNSAEELTDVFERARQEGLRSFGNPAVFLERLVTHARHIEVQVIADGQGTAWAVGVRDCTIQRRHQKIIEESASPVLTEEQADSVRRAAERLALAVDYRGAGTVEFLYEPRTGEFAFLEVNTRLQVEHPITEATTGLDLVKAQLRVASGERLTGPRPVQHGHAIEARINAEDPDRDFAPSPGRIARLRFASGPGIRIDTGVSEGDVVPPDFDSMIAKVIAYGRDRDEALARLRRALTDTCVIIEGGQTNKAFALGLLSRPEVVDGTADTSWLDRENADGSLIGMEHAGAALIVAGIQDYEAVTGVERSHFLETARGRRPQVSHASGRPVDFELRGNSYRLRVLQRDPIRYEVTVEAGEQVHRVNVAFERIDAHAARLVMGDRSFRLSTSVHGPVHLIELDGVAVHRISLAERGVLQAPTPSLVVSTPVQVGDSVEAGDPVIVLESMKMETVLRAPVAARVAEINVVPGSQVESGGALLRLEVSEENEDADASGPPVDLQLPDSTESGSLAADIKGMLLGFDFAADEVDPTDGGQTDPSQVFRPLTHGSVESELDLLSTYADMLELGRPNRLPDEADPAGVNRSPREHLHLYLQTLDVDRAGLPDHFVTKLLAALQHYGVTSTDRSPELEHAIFRLFIAQQRPDAAIAMTSALLRCWLGESAPTVAEHRDLARDVLDKLSVATTSRSPIIANLAQSVRFRWFDEQERSEQRRRLLQTVPAELEKLKTLTDPDEHRRRVEELAQIPQQLARFLGDRLMQRDFHGPEPMLEVITRRHYRGMLDDLDAQLVERRPVLIGNYQRDGRRFGLASAIGTVSELSGNTPLSRGIQTAIASLPEEIPIVLDLYLLWPSAPTDPEERASALTSALERLGLPDRIGRVSIGICDGTEPSLWYFTFRQPGDADDADDLGPVDAGTDQAENPSARVEDRLIRDQHPSVARRLNLWRLRKFDITRLPSPEDVLLYHCAAKSNPADERLVALAQVRDLRPIRDEQGQIVAVPEVEQTVRACIAAIRRMRLERSSDARALEMNHVWVHMWPTVDGSPTQLQGLRHLVPLVFTDGIAELIMEGSMRQPSGEVTEDAVRLSNDPALGPLVQYGDRPTDLLEPMDDYRRKVIQSLRRSCVYPYELIPTLTGSRGRFVEYDLVGDTLQTVDRAPGQNEAGVVVGVISTPTDLHPDGIRRVAIFGDPTQALGAVAEPECARIIAAIDLAERERLPVEWFSLSAGAKIAMDSGTENMDAVARCLKRIIEFTQNGGEINVVVAGINVGAQPYWNAEATMLMHTRGLLIMTPTSAMVLTGKQSLDFSGGVSAEDNFGIGGYDRVMGPNGQAQYFAPDLAHACQILLTHYDRTVGGDAATGNGSVNPSRVARADTTDALDRDISTAPHTLPGSDFSTVGEIFSAEHNAQRKKPFDIRSVLRAVADRDHPMLERWPGMAEAGTAVVTSARTGGWPVTLIGIESNNLPRRGYPPTDGPGSFTAGTLFPQSSKKVARAINSASGRQPVVILANLSGFDGSPESMRNLQLEYGAEIGRAIVNFDGKIVFCVISRYHGGAFVVFSKALNPNLTVLALRGSYASVIGGAPAAAVVFAREVDRRAAAHPEVQQLRDELRAGGPSNELAALEDRYTQTFSAIRAETLTQVANEFDAVHTIERAVEVGSVDRIIDPAELRPSIIAEIDSWAADGAEPAASAAGPASATDASFAVTSPDGIPPDDQESTPS